MKRAIFQKILRPGRQQMSRIDLPVRRDGMNIAWLFDGFSYHAVTVPDINWPETSCPTYLL